MSRRTVGLLLLLVGSMGLGVAVAEWFFRLFDRTIPPAALSSFSKSAAHAAFLSYGVGAGVVLFGWALLAALVAPLFGGGRTKQPEVE